MTAENTTVAQELSEWIAALSATLSDQDEDRITVAMTLIVGPALDPVYTVVIDADGEGDFEVFPSMQAAADAVRTWVSEFAHNGWRFTLALKEMEP